MRLQAIIICTLVAGCASTLSMENAIGVPAGTNMRTVSPGLTFECDPFTSTSEAWFGSSGKKRCMKAMDDAYSSDRDAQPLPKGTLVRLNRFRQINGVDSMIYFVEATIIEGPRETDVIVYSFHLKALLNLEYG